MTATPQSPDNLAQYRYLTATNTEIGIVATPSGVQANAYPLSAQISRIDTVGTTGDSVALPEILPLANGDARLAAVGVLMFVRNAGANACQMFGTNTDTINGAATATGISLPAGKSMIAWASSLGPTGVGTWAAVISA
jgi:hypothetical protein